MAAIALAIGVIALMVPREPAGVGDLGVIDMKIYGPAVAGLLVAFATPAAVAEPDAVSPDAVSPDASASLVPVAAPVIDQNRAHVLPVGTKISLRMREELTTKGKRLRPGKRFELEVAEPVQVEGRTVIPAGSLAVGEVTSVRNKGMWGKSGNIDARILYMHVNGQQVRLSGTVNDKGVTGTAGVVGAVALIPVAGFFMTGTSAVIPKSASVTGFLDQDMPVTFADAAPEAMPGSAQAAIEPLTASPGIPATSTSTAQ